MITTPISHIVNNLYIKSLGLVYTDDIANALYNSTIEQRCSVAGAEMFDFNFAVPATIPEAEFKQYLGTVFCQYYYNYKNGYETEAQFFNKLQAITKLVMPTYSKKIDLLNETNNVNLRDNITRTTESESNAESESNGTGKSKGIASDYPQSVMTAEKYTDIKYARSGDFSESESDSSTKSKSDGKTTETITSGSILQNIEKLNYLDNLFIDLMKEYEKLFLFIW